MPSVLRPLPVRAAQPASQHRFRETIRKTTGDLWRSKCVCNRQARSIYFNTTSQTRMRRNYYRPQATVDVDMFALSSLIIPRCAEG